MAAVTLAGVLALAGAVCLWQPGHTAWLPACPFHQLTGLYCPGCGSTRMLHYLLHGHPGLALQQNAMTLFFLPAAVVVLTRQLVRPRSTPQRGEEHKTVNPLWSGAIAVLLLVFTVARNIPVEPLCKLAPGGVCASTGHAQPAEDR